MTTLEFLKECSHLLNGLTIVLQERIGEWERHEQRKKDAVQEAIDYEKTNQGMRMK